MTGPAAVRNAPFAYVLVGPTAVGKTAVAHALARRHGWALLSADAMQVYRGMDIGTAKPTPEEREGLRYGGIDLVDPDKLFSAGDYMRAVKGQWPTVAPAPAVLVVGGSGLYLRALLQGLTAPPASPEAREEALRLLSEEGMDALREAVRRRSPQVWSLVRDPENPRRLVRAYEWAQTNAAPAIASNAGSPKPVVVGLVTSRDHLAQRIEQRVREMYARGLLTEAAALRSRWGRLSATAEKAIGYAEAFDVLDGRCSEPEAIARTVQRTRQYAKRQLTWFRWQTATIWVEFDAGEPLDEVTDRVERALLEHGPIPLHGLA